MHLIKNEEFRQHDHVLKEIFDHNFAIAKQSNKSDEEATVDASHALGDAVTTTTAFVAQAKGFGYSDETAALWGEAKMATHLDNQGFDKIDLGLKYSLKDMNTVAFDEHKKKWDSCTEEEQRALAHRMGIETKDNKHNLYRLTLCQAGDKPNTGECGQFIGGAERLDKEWLKSGHASEEAVWHKDRELLAAQRNGRNFHAEAQRCVNNDVDKNASEVGL